MKTTTSSKLSTLGLAVATALLTTGAHAASFTWDFQNTAGLPGTSFVETSLAGGQTITMRAYSATNNTTATWATANFTNQGTSGLGISHTGETTTAPQHAVDSIGNTDYVVVDAGAGKTFDWTSLMIGYGYDTYVGGTPGVSGQYATGQADIRLWTGNVLPGTLTGNNISGFSQTKLDNVMVGANTNVDGGTGGNLSPSRYLIIAGDVNDAFKLKSIGGATGSPPNQTPEPASLGLIGLGLLGFAYARRRKTKA